MEPVQNEKGEWVIPASRRPDGTWRKEKIMKEGYVPQDEIRAFATRASSMKDGKKTIPGLAPSAAPVKTKSAQQPKQKDISSVSSTAASLGNMKVSADSVNTNNNNTITKTTTLATSVQTTPAPVVTVFDPKIDAAKKIKALKKKLRDIEEIEQKKVEELTPEQVEKLSKKSEMEAEIVRLSAI